MSIDAYVESINQAYRLLEISLAEAQSQARTYETELREALEKLGQRPADDSPSVPAAPTDLRCAVAGIEADFAWQDNSADEVAFVIEARDTQGDGNWRIIKTSGLNAVSQKVVLPDEDWRYDFRVRAVGATVRGADGVAVTLYSEPSNMIANVFIRRVAAATEASSVMPVDFGNAVIAVNAGSIDAAIAQAKKENRPLVIDGLLFEGKMLKLEGMSRVMVRNCTFRNIAGGWFSGHGILIMQGLKNSFIYDNLFENIGDSDIAGGYGNSTGLHIARNRHIDTKQGIHLVGGGPETDVLIENETFSGLRRMGIELQNGGRRYVVRSCRGGNWRAAADRDRFFISMAAVECERTLVEDCECTAPIDAPSGDAVNRMGINYEIAGRNAICRRVKSVGGFVGPTALSGHGDAVKSQVTFDAIDICGWNEPWGKPWRGSIYRDGTPEGNITITGSCNFKAIC